MSGGYAITARFEAKEGCEELCAVRLESAAIALDEEPGRRRFEILQGGDDQGVVLPQIFMTNELFDDYEAVRRIATLGAPPSAGTASAPWLRREGESRWRSFRIEP